jgi:uncharacterized protein (TIGR02611 family)
MLKRLGVLALGWAVVAVGAILIPLPGPGILIVLGGVAILSLESASARWLLLRCRNFMRSKLPDIYSQLEKFHKEIIRLRKSLFKR